MNEITKYFATKPTLCEMCEQGTVELQTVESSIDYGADDSQTQLSVMLPIWRCEDCGCAYEDEQAAQIKHAAVCQHLGVLEPNEIRDIRNRLGLSQEALANVTSIGVASIKRWESSKIIQNKAMDNLLRLLPLPGAMEQLAKAFINPVPKFRTEISHEQRQAATAFTLRA